MRVFSLLLCLTGLSLTASAVVAQNVLPPTPCDEQIMDQEIAVAAMPGVEDATVTLYDRTGAVMQPDNRTGTAVPVRTSNGQVRTCGLFIGFGMTAGSDPKRNVAIYPDTGGIVTLVFSYYVGVEPEPRTYRILYGTVGHTAGCAFTPQRDAFFCPNATEAQGGGNADFFVKLEPTQVRVSPTYMWSGDHFVDEVIPDDGWALPYHNRVVCATGLCDNGATDPGANLFLMPVDAVYVAGQPFTKRITGAVPFALRATGTYDWTESWLTLAFLPGGRLDVPSPAFRVSGMTFTAAEPAQGWGGVRFEPGSGGAWTGVTVERVRGELVTETAAGRAAVTVTGASPSFTNVILQEPVPGTILTGLAVVGTDEYATAPTATELRVLNMTGPGVSVNGLARVTLRRGEITGSGGAGVVASGGFPARAFLTPAGPGTFGPQITGNAGGGVLAAAGADVRFGTDTSAPGYGLANVTGNGGRGLTAQNGAAVYAGTGTPGGAYQRNRVFNNLPGSATGNGLATGTGSRVFARCAWWNTTTPTLFRVGQASGGLLDASYFLTADPYQVANPPCAIAPQVEPGRAAPGATTTAQQRSASTALLDRLAEAMTADTAVEAVGLLAGLVADAPETEAAAAALGEAGAIAGRAGAPAAATVLLTAATTHAEAALRVSAWQALVASRRANGDAAGALAAADALAGEGGPALVQAETARVYLHGEAGDAAAALGALGRLEALAPTSVEAGLARAFLGLGDTPTGGRSAGTAAAGTGAAMADKAAADAATDAATTLALSPNPASGGAALTLTLAEPADVTVTVYDLLGRAVAVPLAGALAAGTHRASVDVPALAPGVCVARVAVNTAAGVVVRASRLTVAR